jgi:hypothetical protein
MLNTLLIVTGNLDLEFNPTKSFAICFGRLHVEQFSLKVNNTPIKWVANTKYLGCILVNTMDDSIHIRKIQCDFYARANSLFASFKGFSFEIMLYLFDMYCTAYYGLMCCSFRNNAVSGIFVGWNKVIRRLFRLPYRTHVSLLSQVANKPHIKFTIFKNFLSFSFACIRSNNPIVSSIANNLYCNNRSIIGGNLSLVLSHCDFNVCDFPTISKRDLCNVIREMCSVSQDDYRVGFILELVNMLKFGDPDKDILQTLLNYICCH